MKKEKNISGFVLAGGKSKRMGQDKCSTQFRGKNMIDHTLEALDKVCSSVQIISNNWLHASLPYPIQNDLYADKGPLVGICTALEVSKSDLNIILSCDSPNVTPALLIHLIEQVDTYDAVVPVYKQKKYPLCGIYTKACYEVLIRKVKKGQLKVMDALDSIHVRYYELTKDLNFFDENTLANINTLKELEFYESQS